MIMGKLIVVVVINEWALLRRSAYRNRMLVYGASTMCASCFFLAICSATGRKKLTLARRHWVRSLRSSWLSWRTSWLFVIVLLPLNLSKTWGVLAIHACVSMIFNTVEALVKICAKFGLSISSDRSRYVLWELSMIPQTYMSCFHHESKCLYEGSYHLWQV